MMGDGCPVPLSLIEISSRIKNVLGIIRIIFERDKKHEK